MRHSERPELSLMELPISSVGLGGLRLPIAGGNYTRQLPHTLLRPAVSWWVRHHDSPLVFYFMPWELDLSLPLVSAVGWLTRVRQYRNLDKTRWVLEEFFREVEFQSAGDCLGIPYRDDPPSPRVVRRAPGARGGGPAAAAGRGFVGALPP